LRRVELFTAIAEILLSLIPPEDVINHCVTLLARAQERDAVPLLSIIEQVLSDPALVQTTSSALLALIPQIESATVIRTIVRLAFATEAPAVHDFVNEVVGWKSRHMHFDPSEPSIPLVCVRAEPVLAASLLQILFESKLFVAAAFLEPTARLSVFLRLIFAHMLYLKSPVLVVTGPPLELEAWPMAYLESFPQLISGTDRVTMEDFSTPLVIADVHERDFGEIALQGAGYRVIGIILSSQDPYSCFVRLESGWARISPRTARMLRGITPKDVIDRLSLKPQLVIYEKQGLDVPQFDVPTEYLTPIEAANMGFMKERCYFLRDLFGPVSKRANTVQWLGYFFNVLCRGRFECESPAIKERNREMTIRAADLGPYLPELPDFLGLRAGPTVQKWVVAVLKSVLSEPPSECYPIISVLINKALNQLTVPLIQAFCERGATEIEFCAGQNLGQKLVNLLTNERYTGDVGDVLETLMHFPVPEMAKLKQLRMPTDDTRTKSLLGNVLALASIYGYIRVDQGHVKGSEDRILSMLMMLLHRFQFGPVLAFAEYADLMLDVALEIKGDLAAFVSPLLRNPDVLRRLLVSPSSSGVAQSLVDTLTAAMTEDSRERLITELVNGLHGPAPVKALLTTLTTLGFRDAARVWPVVPRIDAGSMDALFELVSRFPVEEVSANIMILLPLLADNPVPRLQYILPALDDRAAQWSGWDDLAKVIGAASNEALVDIAVQLWQMKSFTDFVERNLFQPSVTMTELALPIVLTFQMTAERLSLFLKCLADFLNTGAVNAVDSICRKILNEAQSLSFGDVSLEPEALFSLFLCPGYLE
jgi:hypothetical protein